MTRRRVWVALGIGVLLMSALAAAVPLGVVGFFRVRRVELLGVRYHDPGQVLEILALAPDHNVFAPAGDIVRRAEELPGVIRARVERRLPGTLRIVLEERVPIAFAPGPAGLRALDADARPLPYDPAATGLDLPLVNHADPVLVWALAVVRATDLALYQQVDGARRGEDNVITLDVGRGQVLLRGIPTTNDIRAVGVVHRHLLATGRSFEQVDARFEGWVVVRRIRA